MGGCWEENSGEGLVRGYPPQRKPGPCSSPTPETQASPALGLAISLQIPKVDVERCLLQQALR